MASTTETLKMESTTETEMVKDSNIRPISEATEKVRSTVEGFVRPRVEEPLKVAQDKYEQMKSEYPNTAVHLESAEKRLQDLGERVTQSCNDMVNRGDQVINERIITPVVKVKTAVEKEAKTEEVKEVKKTGLSFYLALVALVHVYLAKALDGLDSLSSDFLPTKQVSVNLVKTSAPSENPTLVERTKYTGADIVNRVYGFLLKKSTVNPKQVSIDDFSLSFECIVPILTLITVVVLGFLRYICELFEKHYTGCGSGTVRGFSKTFLSATDFSMSKSQTDSPGVVPSASEEAVSSVCSD